MLRLPSVHSAAFTNPIRTQRLCKVFILRSKRGSWEGVGQGDGRVTQSGPTERAILNRWTRHNRACFLPSEKM